ncbi:hypothetical protein MCAG_03808 [Micromonospora sp. ATCC 39149]|uniref:hypothetical protein n=1 Tax=Micromonospora sp. (strain ATCC 39149 / NRRL 15099 / SCC 1413) TaxID=219305 RepID=UPI0001A504BB|nr:hypothetical protein [Micromonospora sp. ATCC 39149]EEP73481.1 hypothetical protein MCAG_03808 [Micromonospora sp. ATCC 39149]
MTTLTGERLIHHVAALAVRAHAGEPVAAELAEAARMLRQVYDNPPGLPYRHPWPRRRYPTIDPQVALRDRVDWDGGGCLALPAGEVRRARRYVTPPDLAGWLNYLNLATLPVEPVDDDALVVVYDVTSPVAPLLLAVARGQDTGPAVEHLVGRVVHSRRHPWEW